jgi:HSP20 family protein
MLPMVRPNWFAAPTSDPFTQLRREMDSVFDRFFGGDGWGLTPAWSSTPFTIWEDEDHYTIEADVPGVAESDIEVTVHNGMLFIRGERKAEEGRNYLYNGRPFGRFERVVTLPSTVVAEGVQASLNNGVLRIVLSKSPESKPKRINVQTS